MDDTSKRAPVLKIPSLHASGETNEEPIEIPLRTNAGDVITTEAGEPAIVFTGTPVPFQDWQRRLKKYTKKVPNAQGRGMVETVDSDQAVLDLLVERIENWRGVVDVEGKDIPCTAATKPIVFAHLDAVTRGKIASGLTGGEVSDLSEFR